MTGQTQLQTVHSPRSRNERSFALDLARIVSALLVVSTHFADVALLKSDNPDLIATGRLLHMTGPYGTNLLLAISGYLMARTVLNRRSWFSFVEHRFLRLAPNVAAVMVMYLLMWSVVPERSRLPADPVHAFISVGSNLLLLSGALPVRPIITVSWSLSYIMLFGAVFAAVCQKLQSPRLPYTAVAVVLFTAMFMSVGTEFYRMSFLVLGAGIAETIRRYPVRADPASFPPEAVPALAYAPGFLIAVDFGMNRGAFVTAITEWTIVGSALVALELFRITPGQQWQKSLVSHIGKRSYSIYLMHSFVLNAAVALAGAGHSVGGTLLLFVVSVLATYVLANVLYQQIEMRFVPGRTTRERRFWSSLSLQCMAERKGSSLLAAQD